MGNYLNDLESDSLSSQSSNCIVLSFIDRTLKTVPGFKYRRHNRPVFLFGGNHCQCFQRLQNVTRHS